MQKREAGDSEDKFPFSSFSFNSLLLLFLKISIVVYKDTIDIALPIRLNLLACGKFYFSVFTSFILVLGINLIALNTSSVSSMKV